MSQLELGPLEKAVYHFEKGVREAEENPRNELMRDGVIQRFEYSIDLAWKFLQRYLRTVLQIEDALIRSKKDIFREAARAQLIDDAEAWIAHYEARNETSQDYYHEKATTMYAQALRALPDIARLLGLLRSAHF